MFAHQQGYGGYGPPGQFDIHDPMLAEELPNLAQAGFLRHGPADMREPRVRDLMGVIGAYLRDLDCTGHSAASQAFLERLYGRGCGGGVAHGRPSPFDPYLEPPLQLARLLQPCNSGCGPRTFSAVEQALVARLADTLRDPLRAAHHLVAVDSIERPMHGVFDALQKHPAEVRRMVDDCPCVFGWLRPESRRALRAITGPVPRAALRCLRHGHSAPHPPHGALARRPRCLHDHGDILPAFQLRFAPRCSCCGRRAPQAGTGMGDYGGAAGECGDRYGFDDFIFDSDEELCMCQGDGMLVNRREPHRQRRMMAYRNIGFF